MFKLVQRLGCNARTMPLSNLCRSIVTSTSHPTPKDDKFTEKDKDLYNIHAYHSAIIDRVVRTTTTMIPAGLACAIPVSLMTPEFQTIAMGVAGAVWVASTAKCLHVTHTDSAITSVIKRHKYKQMVFDDNKTFTACVNVATASWITMVTIPWVMHIPFTMFPLVATAGTVGLGVAAAFLGSVTDIKDNTRRCMEIGVIAMYTTYIMTIGNTGLFTNLLTNNQGFSTEVVAYMPYLISAAMVLNMFNAASKITPEYTKCKVDPCVVAAALTSNFTFMMGVLPYAFYSMGSVQYW
jgi:hypothetical protein